MNRSVSSASSVPSVAKTVLLVLICVATLLRFFLVDRIPPGFYIDEAAISAQVICLRQSWHSLFGESISLFTPVLGGGYLTASYLAPSLLWTAIFGDSIESFRSMTAFFSCFFVFGSCVLGSRVWRSQEAGWLCALSAAISPWAFQFARIAWDPSLVPAYLVWALAFTWPRANRRIYEDLIGALLFAASAYCYPPVRLQLVFVLPMLAWARYRAMDRESASRAKTLLHAAGFLMVIAILGLPLMVKTLSGEIQGRFEVLSIFNEDFLRSNYGDTSVIYSADAFFKNLGSFFSPYYLLLHGDENLRHSTGLMGEWSWLDAVGVLLATATAILIALKKMRPPSRVFEIAFVLVGYFAGLIPAALTWESNPHALRSIGALVFLCLGVGGSLSLLWRESRRGQSAVLGMALASFLIFVNVYFVHYSAMAGPWFDKPVYDTYERLRADGRVSQMRSELMRQGIDYDPMAISYYQLASGQRRCEAGTPFLR